MRRLSALDAQFLHAETATTTTHVAGVAILDPRRAPGGTLTRDALVDLLRARLHLVPPMRMRLVETPFGLDHPYWVEDPEVDPADHVFETTLPAPGDERALAEAVARIHERRLDRGRPLWEMHLIHGLSGGRVAVYTKIHHSAIDGVSGAEVLAAVLDLSPEGREVARPEPAAPPEPVPDRAALLVSAVLRAAAQPVRAARALARFAGDLDAIPLLSALPGAELCSRAVRTLTGRPATLPRTAPPVPPATPFNGPISARRVFAAGSLPLADVKQVARTYGVSTNDVVMTLCAAALRAWLGKHDALPDRPLVAAVPVAVRTASGTETVGNQLSVMIAPLPTDEPSPLRRLQVMGETMRRAKRRFALAPATWLEDLSALLPPALGALATPALFRLAGTVLPPINLIVSNVPGPQFPLYLGGARLLSYYPVSAISDLSGGVSVTCFSYDGFLDFGVLACPEHMPDPETLIGCLQQALAELRTLAETEPPDDRPVRTPSSGPAAA